MRWTVKIIAFIGVLVLVLATCQNKEQGQTEAIPKGVFLNWGDSAQLCGQGRPARSATTIGTKRLCIRVWA